MATIGLLLLTLCSGVTWHRDLKSWQIDWQPSVNYHWQWRDQWSIPFTPYQANIMRSLIEEATASPPIGQYYLDLSKWPPIIHGMWKRGEVNAYQLVSLAMWYEDGSNQGFGRESEVILDDIHEAVLQLSRERLSPEWAVIAGVECERHIWQDKADRKPTFRELSKSFYKLAQKLDPSWDAPYIGLTDLYQSEISKGVIGHVDDLDSYERNKNKLAAPPAVLKTEAHRLMKLYMSATDYRSVARPPWAERFVGRPTWGSPVSLPVNQWPPASLVKLLTIMSIDERNADDFAFVLDFIANSQLHDEYYGASLWHYRDIYFTAQNRIADSDVMQWLRQVYEYSISSPQNKMPEGEYRKQYPEGSPTYSEVNEQRRVQQFTDKVLVPLQKAAARLRELGPKAFAPKGMHDAIIKFRREAWDSSEYVWPFSDEAAQLWEKLPPGVELTIKSRLAVTYLLGWQLLPNMGNGDFCEQAWKNHASSSFNDPEAGFAQRATVAYWTPYYKDENYLEKALAELGDNDDLFAGTPEWAYTAWAFAEKSYSRYRTNLKGYDNLRDACRPAKEKYITLAADMAPDWVQAQKTRLETAFESAMDNAAKAAGTDKDHSRHTGLDFWMPFVSDGDAQGVYRAVQAFIAADDCRVLLPLPWAVRISKEELAQIAPNSNLLRMYDKPEVEYSYSTGLRPEEHLPVFLIKHGCSKKHPEVAASAFLYMEHLYRLSLDSEPHPSSRAWDLKKACDAIAPYLADTLAKVELTKLADDLQHKCSLISNLYHYKTSEFQLSADELAAAKSAYARQEAELNTEILETARKMAEIVAGLQESDFVTAPESQGK